MDEKDKTRLSEAQQQSLSRFVIYGTFEVFFESAMKRINKLGGGTVKLSIDFTPEAGRNVKFYHVYSLSQSGAMKRLSTRFFEKEAAPPAVKSNILKDLLQESRSGVLQFSADQMEDYAIVYNEDVENDTGKPENTEPDEPEKPEKESKTDDTPTAAGQAKKNAIKLNASFKVSQTGKKINVKWSPVKGADRYRVYAAYCGRSGYKKVAERTKSTRIRKS